MNKYTEQLQQIEKRIAELQRKAAWVRAQIEPNVDGDFVHILPETGSVFDFIDNSAKVAEQVTKARRGRRKLNEAV